MNNFTFKLTQPINLRYKRLTIFSGSHHQIPRLITPKTTTITISNYLCLHLPYLPIFIILCRLYQVPKFRFNLKTTRVVVIVLQELGSRDKRWKIRRKRHVCKLTEPFG
ncbi:hypothetical protein HanXRQr2_Chr10g0425031 [Helianthus annuus]|uniref:Uncharacterized protein n=1 Tax=Helianthus annuus TaxID=4232 RepID=A0A9K3N3A6_HELAN|nr:hypothetical protein HanXRQr2_Chr10g0425031 [Helianthus annuus]